MSLLDLWLLERRHGLHPSSALAQGASVQLVATCCPGDTAAAPAPMLPRAPVIRSLSPQTLLKMDTFLLLYTLVLGHLSFVVLSWLSCHVRMFEEGYQVRWCGGQALCSLFLWLRGPRREAQISPETLNNSSRHVSVGKEWGYWKQEEGFDMFDRFLLNVFDKSGDEDQGGRG